VDSGDDMRAYLYVNSSIDPVISLAIDEALLREIESIGYPVIKLCGFSREVITVGRYTELENEVNIDAVKKKRNATIKRTSARGSAIHCREYELNFTMVFQSDASAYLSAATQLSYILDPVFQAVKSITAYASLNKWGDIVINRRKLSGSAQIRKKTGTMLHGYLFFSGDPYYLSSILKKSREKIERKGLIYPNWVTTLSHECKREMHLEDTISLVKQFLKRRYSLGHIDIQDHLGEDLIRSISCDYKIQYVQ